MNPTDQEIRAWARQNGYQVGERGRLQENVKAAYYRYHDLLCQECWQLPNNHRSWCITGQTTKDGNVETVTVEVVAEIPEEESTIVPPLHNPPVASETPVQPTNTADATFSALVAQIAASTLSTVPQSIPEEEVRAIAREEAETAAINAVAELTQPKIVHVHLKDRETVVFEERTHVKLEKVVKYLSRKRNVYLYGPPGTGKSTIAMHAAKALGVPYGDISCEPTMSATKIFGFVDANGVCQSTLFKEIFTGGGVWNYEEIDNGHPGVTAAMNTALANGHCAFPDGIGVKHPDFYAIATANTIGNGATEQFVGRNALDKATLDRFVKVRVDIDEDIEEMAVMAEISDIALGKEWLTKVREWRKNVADLKLNVIISPRGAINGAVALDLGFSWEEAAEECIFSGMDANTRSKIEKGF